MSTKKTKSESTTKSKNIKHIKGPNYFDLLKEMTKWFGNNNRTVDQLHELIEKFELKDITSIWSRIISLCYSNPKIIKYLNKYFNNLFEWYKIKQFGVELIFLNIAFIMDLNLHKQNKFYFLKSNDEKDQNKAIVTKLLFEFYLKNNNKFLNTIELNNLYKLFNLNEITTEQLNILNKYLDPDNKDLEITPAILNKPEIITEDVQNEINQFVLNSKTKQLPIEINEFANNFKFYLSDNNINCKNCELKNTAKVLLDTNISSTSDYIDILFINFQSSQGDLQYNKPLSDSNLDIFRQKLFYLPSETKWMILNLIPCFSNDKRINPKNSKIIIQNCFPNVTQLIQKFRSQYIVTIGKTVFDTFGLKGSILSKSGQIDNINNQSFLCLVDPISIIKYNSADNVKAFNNTFNTLYNLMNKKYNKEVNNTHQFSQQVVEKKTNILDETIKKLNFQRKEESINSQPIDFESFDKSSKKQFQDKQFQQNNIQNFVINVKQDKMIDEPSEDMTLFDVKSLDENNILITYIKDGKKYYSIKPYITPIFIKNKPWYECEMLDKNIDQICFVNKKQHKKLKSKLIENLEVMKNSCING